MPRILNIHTGYDCEHINTGTDIVIFQGENQEYSSLYGKQLTFIEYFRQSNRVKLAFKRGLQAANTGGKVVHPVFIPNTFDGQLSDLDGNRYVQLNLMPRSSVRERFPSEAITNVRFDETTTEMFIEIAAECFTFAFAQEFHSIFQLNDNGLPYLSEGDTLICTAPVSMSHSDGMRVWTNAAELTVTDTCTSGTNGIEGYYCAKIRTQDWSFNNGVQTGGTGVVTILPIEDSTQADYKVYRLRANDEVFIEIGQLMWLPIISRTAHPTPMPSKFMFQGVPIPAWFDITYHTRDGQTVEILEADSSRRLRDSREMLEQSIRAYTESTPDTLTQVATYAYSGGVTPSRIASLGPISMTRNSPQQEWQALYHGLSVNASEQSSAPPPTQPKYTTGTVVMATIEGRSSIPARYKNKEWKIHGYIGYSSSRKEHQYKIQSNIKKNINKGTEMIAMESELIPVEKILKRKFELARKIGKYQQGQVFTKEELVNTFAKFQDAQDPFILNKIYICAESPSEK